MLWKRLSAHKCASVSLRDTEVPGAANTSVPAGLELGAEVAMGWGNMSLNRITTTENKYISRICEVIHTLGFMEKKVSSLDFGFW